MDPTTNRPYDQPDQCKAVHYHFHEDDTPVSITVNFQNPKGMATPRRQWEDAVTILLEDHSIQELPTRAIWSYNVMDCWTVVEEEDDSEHQIETATTFRLRLQSPRNGEMPQIVGRALSLEVAYDEQGNRNISTPEPPLATVEIRMEFQDTPETRRVLQEMMEDPNSYRCSNP